jgi:hypothetical protein
MTGSIRSSNGSRAARSARPRTPRLGQEHEAQKAPLLVVERVEGPHHELLEAGGVDVVLRVVAELVDQRAQGLFLDGGLATPAAQDVQALVAGRAGEPGAQPLRLSHPVEVLHEPAPRDLDDVLGGRDVDAVGPHDVPHEAVVTVDELRPCALVAGTGIAHQGAEPLSVLRQNRLRKPAQTRFPLEHLHSFPCRCLPNRARMRVTPCSPLARG